MPSASERLRGLVGIGSVAVAIAHSHDATIEIIWIAANHVLPPSDVKQPARKIPRTARSAAEPWPVVSKVCSAVLIGIETEFATLFGTIVITS